MRKLILRRKKTLVATLVKLRVFIEHVSGDLEINGVRYKEIGLLKSGSMGEYEIPNGNVHIAVVSSKINPWLYNTCYRIPAGEGTVELYASPELSPMKGNPFKIYGKEDRVNMEKDGW
jgi:hypothetical protein